MGPQRLINTSTSVMKNTKNCLINVFWRSVPCVESAEFKQDKLIIPRIVTPHPFPSHMRKRYSLVARSYIDSPRESGMNIRNMHKKARTISANLLASDFCWVDTRSPRCFPRSGLAPALARVVWNSSCSSDVKILLPHEEQNFGFPRRGVPHSEQNTRTHRVHQL